MAKKVPYSVRSTTDPRAVLLQEIGRIKIKILSKTKLGEDTSDLDKLLQEKEELLKRMGAKTS